MGQRRLIKTGLGMAILIFMIMTALPVQAAWTAAYDIKKYDIRVELSPEGQALITETISYDLHEDLDDFQYLLAYEKDKPIQLVTIGVADRSAGLEQPIFIKAVPAAVTNNQVLPLTYQLVDDGEMLDIRLHTFFKAETDCTVSLTYELPQAVVSHKSAAVLSRRFFLLTGGAVAKQPSLTLVLPESAPALRIWSLPSSLADFVTGQPADNQLTFQASYLPSGQNLNLTCLFPDEYFPKAVVASEPMSWDQLTAQARTVDSQLHQQENFRTMVYRLIFILIALAAVLGLLVYWLYDREGAAKFRQRYIRDIPEPGTPAIIALLLGKKKPSRLILSMLLDLVRRGELALDGCVFTLLHPERTDFSGFLVSEVYLLQWLFGKITLEHTLSTAQIRSYARDEATAQVFRTYYRQYRELLDEEMSSHYLVDRHKTARGRLIAGLVALVYFVLAIGMTAFLQTLAGLLLLLPAVIFLIYRQQIRRLTPVGQEAYAQSQALYRYMRMMTRLQPPPDIDFIRQSLPIALATGLSTRFFSQIRRLWPAGCAMTDLGIHGLGSGKDKAVTDQLQAFVKDLGVMESMLSASLLLAEGIHI